MRVNYIKNAFALAGFITFVFIFFHFISGNYARESIQGTWRAVCIQDEIIFDGGNFTRGRDSGEFRVRANLIYFCIDGEGYPIRITERYMVLNGIYYQRTETPQS